MSQIEFRTNKLKIVFEENPFRIVQLSDLSSGQIYISNAVQAVILRNPKHISDPVLLSCLKNFKVNNDKIEYILTDENNINQAEISISEHPQFGIRFSAEFHSDEIIWLAEWKVTGCNFDNVLVPALGGQMLSNDMTPDLTLSYKYPFWWNAQFVIGETKGNYLLIHMKDTSSDLKLLRVRKTEKNFQIFLGFEADAPLTKKDLSAEWFLNSYSNHWTEAVDTHREWLENNFNLENLQNNPKAPLWLKDINFVLELWGMRKDQPEPHHTFTQMIERIEEWQQYHSPANTLLYLPGFAENGIDSHAPDYNPSERCGGETEFKKLISRAHELGYHVMLHTNVLAMTYTHPLYEQFKKFQVIDPFNRSMGWAMDIDGDWLAEDFFAYMNPGFKEWGDYMQGVIGKLINEYNADSIFLDQTLLAFNVSNGPDFLKGMKEHILRMQRAYPNTLFAGEGLNEQVLEALPFAQIHGLDSITEVHGMEGKKKWRKVHPVSVYLFDKYTKFSAHLLTKYPSNPQFKFQENSYKKLGVIPALCLYDYKQKINIPEVHKMLKRVKNLKPNYRK